MLTQKQEQQKSTMYSELWSKVYEASIFSSLPQAEIDRYVKQTTDDYVAVAAGNNQTLEEYLTANYGIDVATFDTEVLSETEERVKSDLILYSIARAEGLEITAEEYTEKLNEYFNTDGNQSFQTIEEFEAYYSKEYMTSNMLYQEVLEFLYTNAVIK
jgi:FKBP-type peptidyl-prolyl cis-trans isomerase (trigger factor)